MKDFFSEEGESILDRSISDMTINVRKDWVKVIVKAAQSCLTLCDPMDCTVMDCTSQLVKNPPAMWESWVRSLGWEDPLEMGQLCEAYYNESFK